MSAKTIIFGTAEYKGVHAGLTITSIRKGKQSQQAEALDEEGNVMQTDRYGKKQTVQIEATVKGDIAALDIGSVLTIDGDEYEVDTVDTSKTNTGHHTASITASRPYKTSAQEPSLP